MTVEFEDMVGDSFDFSDEGFETVDQLLLKILTVNMESLSCPFDVSVSVSVVSEEEIQGLNRDYREIDSVTDVLSFPMNEFEEPALFDGGVFLESETLSPETGELMLGDVILCRDAVFRQAEEFGHSVLREFSFLVTHSILHLCGFDHIEDSDRVVMEEKQSKIMEKLGIKR